MQIEAKTRKTKQGYFQPVLIVDRKVRHTPADMSEPCIDRATAQKQAEWWRNEAIQTGTIPII